MRLLLNMHFLWLVMHCVNKVDHLISAVFCHVYWVVSIDLNASVTVKMTESFTEQPGTLLKMTFYE